MKMNITYTTTSSTKVDIIELAQHAIAKFYEEGYITSSEDIALFEELNNMPCEAGYIQMQIKVESRKLEFVCFDNSICVYSNRNLSISAYITVLTPQDEPDFSVSYSSNNDKFYVNEPHLN